MNRAYATFEIKSFDEGDGILRGIASTPATDRVGDVVEPKGASFKLPLPLLWQHNSAKPIGTVTSATVTAKGIEVVAKVAKGVTADIDEAWKLIKAGLVRGFSIGFKGLDVEQIPNSYGVRFKKWEWLELSAVTIPANQEATILSVKQFDSPGASSGASTAAPVVHLARGMAAQLNPKGNKMSTESIRAMEAERSAKMARMQGIMSVAEKEGRTMDAEEQKDFDATQQEVVAIDGHLTRLKAFENLSGTTVKAVDKGGVTITNPTAITHVRKNDDVPGIGMARFMQALAVTKGHHFAAAEYASERFKDDPRIALALKAAVAPGTTAETTWASPLVNEWGAVAADFLAYLRPQTIIGKFGAGNIPSLRRVPFRLPLVSQTTGGAAYWTGEGKPKGLTKFDFTAGNLDPLKVANIAVITKELARDSSPSASMLVRDQLVAACAARLDTDFIDPAKTAVSGVSPASITQGVSAPNSAGTDEDGVRADIQTIMATFLDANNAPQTGVWIMRPTVALALGLMTNGLGQKSFLGIGVNGGEFAGLPVITSNYVPSPTAGDYLILVNAQDIYLADEGGFTLDMSTEASLQMDSEPTDPVTDSTVMVSLWQHNLIGFLCERTINWTKARATAVAMVDTVNYSAGT